MVGRCSDSTLSTLSAPPTDVMGIDKGRLMTGGGGVEGVDLRGSAGKSKENTCVLCL